MIIQQIQIKGVTQRLTVSDVIQLHRLGVREPVITRDAGRHSGAVARCCRSPRVAAARSCRRHVVPRTDVTRSDLRSQHSELAELMVAASLVLVTGDQPRGQVTDGIQPIELPTFSVIVQFADSGVS